MARGVSKDFIHLLFDDAQSAKGRLTVVIALAVVFAGLAALLWGGLSFASGLISGATGLGVHVVALGAGFGLGWAAAAKVVARYEISLRDEWNEWMRLAPACDTVADVGRKVAGRRVANRAYWIAGVLLVLWALELGLLALAFNGTDELALTAPVVAANGLVVGLLLGHQVRMMTWTRAFAKSLAEMMRDGEVGVWGSR